MPGRVKTSRSKEKRLFKRQNEESELALLKQQIEEFDLNSEITKFSELPLSKQTSQGLRQSHFITLTDIQRKALPLALKGRDILGAAKTGSGKTLAFVIPILESLHVRKWNQQNGLGALIISPTRELAVQIFQVLCKVGCAHQFSAGLVIGGKDIQTEKDRLSIMNILVCTPGRMLQHLDQTAGFEADNLQILVLDEADRILDMGFKKTVDAIIETLPRNRQTLLFSATQTKSVSDLARLSLKNPEYVAVHETLSTSTPESLQQHFVVIPLPNKLDTLFSFLKSHLKTKVLVFFSSCKQVRFVYETFKKMHPGIPLLHLHGKQKQTARAKITARFSFSKYVCLFSTDVVARGLDFPAVDWVIQVDAPEDADTYIHRVGRTARYERAGRALLMLTPSEETSFIKRLSSKKVPIKKIAIKNTKKMSIKDRLQAFCFKDPEIKYLGQKAFVSYMRSIFLQKDKETFNIENIPHEVYAASLGLPGTPRIKLGNVSRAKDLKNNPHIERSISPETTSGSDGDESNTESKQSLRQRDKTQCRTKYDRMFERRNQDILSEHYGKLVKHNEDIIDDDFMTVKRKDHDLTIENAEKKNPLSKRKARQALSKKAVLKNAPKGTKVVFDDEGEPHLFYELQGEERFLKAGPPEHQKLEFLKVQSGDMEEKDLLDRQQFKDKRREKALRRKAREKEGALCDIPSDNENKLDTSSEPAAEENPRKRKAKWFETDDLPANKKSFQVDLNSLEDQEALATYLLRGV